MAFQTNTNAPSGGPRNTPIKALVLDDDAFDRSRIRRFTEKCDLNVLIEEAPSLSAMADIMGQTSFDLIMVDYNLAEGDGLEALEMIQRDRKNKDAAVIMISGQEQTSVAVSAFRQGCQDFLTKHELSIESLRNSMISAISQNDARLVFNPLGSAAFQTAVEVAVMASFQSDRVQAAIAKGITEATENMTLGDVAPTAENVTRFVTDFLDEQDFHFNSLPNTEP